MLLVIAGCYDTPAIELDVARDVVDVNLGVKVCDVADTVSDTSCRPHGAGLGFVFSANESSTKVHVFVSDATSTVLIKLDPVSSPVDCRTVPVGSGLLRFDVHVTATTIDWDCDPGVCMPAQPCSFE